MGLEATQAVTTKIINALKTALAAARVPARNVIGPLPNDILCYRIKKDEG